MPRWKHPSVGTADISRVVEKSVNSVFAFGAKNSVHSLLPEGNPLGGRLLPPPNPLALGFGGAMLTPGGRAAVTSFFSRNFEDHTVFGFVDPAAGTQSPEPEAGIYVPSYVPEGYERTLWDWDDDFGTVRAWYEGAYDLYYINYMCFPLAHAPTIAVDNEHSTETLITIGKDCQAHLLETISPDYPSFLIWMDEEKGAAFLIAGYVSPEELIRVAESVQAQ